VTRDTRTERPLCAVERLGRRGANDPALGDGQAPSAPVDASARVHAESRSAQIRRLHDVCVWQPRGKRDRGAYAEPVPWPPLL